jgi:hypothetical protein
MHRIKLLSSSLIVIGSSPFGSLPPQTSEPFTLSLQGLFDSVLFLKELCKLLNLVDYIVQRWEISEKIAICSLHLENHQSPRPVTQNVMTPNHPGTNCFSLYSRRVLRDEKSVMHIL